MSRRQVKLGAALNPYGSNKGNIALTLKHLPISQYGKISQYVPIKSYSSRVIPTSIKSYPESKFIPEISDISTETGRGPYSVYYGEPRGSDPSASLVSVGKTLSLEDKYKGKSMPSIDIFKYYKPTEEAKRDDRDSRLYLSDHLAGAGLKYSKRKNRRNNIVK